MDFGASRSLSYRVSPERVSIMVGHTWRSLLFGLDGWRHYLKSGFESASRSFTNEHLTLDLVGKHVMITGANSGIGFETSLQMAKQGATVTMVCRDEGRGLAARDKIRDEIKSLRKETPQTTEKNTETVNLAVCDVSSQRAVKELVANFFKSGLPLHVLVNNAGCMSHHFAETKEGTEVNYATNAVAVWGLTNGLTPVLRRSAIESKSPSRVICVASAGMLTEKIELQDPEMRKPPQNKFDGTRQYARNKRAQVVLMELLATREKERARESKKNEEILFVSQHPGWTDTDAVKVALPGFYDSLKSRLRSPWEGADTVVWLATVSHEKIQSGGFYFDRKEVPKHVSFNSLTGTLYTPNDASAMERHLQQTHEKACVREV